MIRASRTAGAALVFLAVLGSLAGVACANRVEAFPTPTVISNPTVAPARVPATVPVGPTATPTGRATPASASDVNQATTATATPTAVGGGSNDTFHFRGPADALVTVAEFADFQ